MFGFGKNINSYIEEYKETANAALIDVREPNEYKAGHIPGAKNIPLSEIETISIDKNQLLYVYCLRGARSRKAVSILKKKGYMNVISIGGIKRYRGELQR